MICSFRTRTFPFVILSAVLILCAGGCRKGAVTTEHESGNEASLPAAESTTESAAGTPEGVDARDKASPEPPEPPDIECINVPWNPGDPDPTIPKGIPGKRDPLDRETPTGAQLRKALWELPGDIIADETGRASTESTEGMRFIRLTDGSRWKRPLEDPDAEPGAGIGISELRKVDLDRDGQTDVAAIISDHHGLNGRETYIGWFSVDNNRLMDRTLIPIGSSLDYYYGMTNIKLRRLGNCVELIGECWKPCRSCEGVACRAVYGVADDRLQKLEYASAQPKLDDELEDYIPEPGETAFTHNLNVDALRSLCNP